jgi:hypothetical protein
MIILSLLVSYLPSLLVDARLREERMFITRKLCYFVIVKIRFIKFSQSKYTNCDMRKVFLIMMLWLCISGVEANDRRVFENYNRAKFKCGQQCETKGYFS